MATIEGLDSPLGTCQDVTMTTTTKTRGWLITTGTHYIGEDDDGVFLTTDLAEAHRYSQASATLEAEYFGEDFAAIHE